MLHTYRECRAEKTVAVRLRRQRHRLKAFRGSIVPTDGQVHVPLQYEIKFVATPLYCIQQSYQPPTVDMSALDTSSLKIESKELVVPTLLEIQGG